MPRGENFYYRHRSAVADGTPCHPGRGDICVDGVCKVVFCGRECTQTTDTFSVICLFNCSQMFPFSMIRMMSYSVWASGLYLNQLYCRDGIGTQPQWFLKTSLMLLQFFPDPYWVKSMQTHWSIFIYWTPSRKLKPNLLQDNPNTNFKPFPSYVNKQDACCW